MRPALALALCALAVLVRASAASSDIPWPSYCGEDRPIPPLDASIPVTLMQAQVIVRHGDRTPAFNHMCWVDNTAVWECDMSQLQLSSVTPWETTAPPTRLYRKVFQPGAEVLPNGNCGLGQLTTVGYNQHIKNGQVRCRCLAACQGEHHVADGTRCALCCSTCVTTTWTR